ncbi:HesA/MoeB/ThiF family protein [Chryseobacterium culicis]|uniref:Molybdopterin-synthase adenylyltransferase n=1 Tax=Chryseobacterium culicis TaxID=680127 RepID=A0A1H6IN71_CHRCI|nr:HesA/MoeB/ThiF family protein [Chryseobacterium culicis]SEH47708.1 adenylyltransferase and sulfurtransferase [Chryseobacterium culicis]
MLNKDRYDRQIKLRGFGIEAQQKLLSARVLVIGAGGLGCPVLQYLTASGIGTIGIVDHDVVSISNLQRQVLYTTEDIGQLKTEVASKRLRLMNPDIFINIISEQITSKNAVKIINEYDLVLDCSDNFPTRYLIDDSCRIMKKTLIFGAIYQYEGQIAVFNIPNKEGVTTSYRNLFPQPPKPNEVPDCNEAGVLGVLPGIIGTLQATEAIKIITGIGKPLANKLMSIDLLDYQTAIYDIPIEIESNSNFPSTIDEFELMNYEEHCGINNHNVKIISSSEFLESAKIPDTLIIDVRELDEFPKIDLPYLSIPLSQLNEKIFEIQHKNIIVICQSGKRSLMGAQLLQENLSSEYQISSLEGGINHLKNLKNE